MIDSQLLHLTFSTECKIDLLWTCGVDKHFPGVRQPLGCSVRPGKALYKRAKAVSDDWLHGSLGALMGLPLLSEQGQNEMWPERLASISTCHCRRPTGDLSIAANRQAGALGPGLPFHCVSSLLQHLVFIPLGVSDHVGGPRLPSLLLSVEGSCDPLWAP